MTEEERLITNVGSRIDAGGNIMINTQLATVEEGPHAGEAAIQLADSRNVTIRGSDLQAGGEVIAAAGDTLSIEAGESSYEYERRKTKRGFAGLSGSASRENHHRLATRGTDVQGTEGVTLISGGDTNVLASQIASDDDIHVGAGLDGEGAVNIVSGYDIARDAKAESSFSFGLGMPKLFESEAHGEVTERSFTAPSQLTAGGRINLTAPDDIRITGSDLTGKAGINVDAGGDLIIESAAERARHNREERSLELTGLDLGQALLQPHEMIQVEDGQFKIRGGEGRYDAEDLREVHITQRGSRLVSDGDIRLQADRDLSVIGSQVLADHDEDGRGAAILRAGNDLSIIDATEQSTSDHQETHGKAEVSLVVQHQAVEVVKAAQDLNDARQQLEQAQDDYADYRHTLEQAQDSLDRLEQDHAAGAPGVTWQDVQDLREQVADLKDDEAWYQTGIEMAKANVVSKTTLLAQQAQAGAASASSYAFGFNIGLQADIQANQSTTQAHETRSAGSTVSGAQVSLQAGRDEGDQLLIRGSGVSGDRVDLGGHEINILASRNSATQRTDSESGELTAAVTLFGADSGATLNLAYERDRARDRAVNYTNSEVHANRLNIDSVGDTNLLGATVRAEQDLQAQIGGDLNIVSRLNRSSGSSAGYGVSAGISLGQSEDGDFDTVTGISGGANQRQGSYASTDTVASSLTSGGTADIDVEGNTHLSGSLLATVDEQGNDLGQLNLTTGSLTYDHLRNEQHSRQRSAGISANVGLGATPPEPGMQEGANGLSPNTSQLSTTYDSRDQRGVTLATLGQGDIHLQDPEASDDLTGLNRDTTQTDRELYRIEQQRQIDLTVDHRLLNEAGRAAIREQIATLPATVKATYDEVATQVTLLTHPAPDAAVDAGGQITEDLYEALIRRGYSVEDATAILADEAFQAQVLASMKTMAEMSGPLMGGDTPPEADTSAPADTALPNAYYDDQGLPVVELETTVVTAERLPDTPAQVVLKGAAEINAYLEAHPDQQRIVEIGLAVAQGPKGVIGLLVGEALANTPVGEALGEKLYEAGELVAEWVEGYDLEGDQDEQDRYLIGGGTFATGVVLGGMAPGGRRGDGERGPAGAETGQSGALTEQVSLGEGNGVVAPNSGVNYPSVTRPIDSSPANTILGDLDDFGRPTGVVSTIKPSSLDAGTPANPYIRPPGFEGRNANHARGHLLARMLGGAGDDARNLVTLFQRNANHPNMSGFERQVRDAVRDGETVNLRVIPIYSGNNAMPTGVTLSARGSRGFDLDVSIPNVNGVQ